MAQCRISLTTVCDTVCDNFTSTVHLHSRIHVHGGNMLHCEFRESGCKCPVMASEVSICKKANQTHVTGFRVNLGICRKKQEEYAFLIEFTHVPTKTKGA